MGEMEKENRKRVRVAKIQKIILQSVATAGIISVGLVAPNVLGAIAKLGIIKTKRQREYINRSRNRLLEAGLLKKDSRGFVSLTKKGELALRNAERADYRLPRPKCWDKKWRVLIFDIPERLKTIREKLRLTLRSIGFVQLQKSVWVYPYDCEDFIILLKTDFMIGKNVLYMIVDSIENDKKLKDYFELN